MTVSVRGDLIAFSITCTWQCIHGKIWCHVEIWAQCIPIIQSLGKLKVIGGVMISQTWKLGKAIRPTFTYPITCLPE